MKVKTIDKYLIKQFLPPFFMAVFIALFVLFMQFMWLWIDEIAGKGVGFFVLMEMVYYLILSFIPMALPIGVLLAAVMVFGNLAEKYELASFKTAGVPLFRMMTPVILLSFLISIFSVVTANYVIPFSNLKFRSRLYDIKKQKPALNLEAGTFNDDFQGFAIRIGKKNRDNRHIEDVRIEDNNANNKRQFSITRAEKGEMYVTEDDNYFVIDLENGYQYQQAKSTIGPTDFPFVRIKFEKWTKVFDLGEFDLSRTDENLFKGMHAMLSSSQLQSMYDTSKAIISKIEGDQMDDTEFRISFLYYAVSDSLQAISAVQKGDSSKNAISKLVNVVKQPFLDSIHPNQSIIYSFDYKFRERYLENALNIAKSGKNRNFEYWKKKEDQESQIIRNRYEYHHRWSLAAACIIFLFIGAPMGAIVRKGGFGYPLLVAIIFFMIFVILDVAFKKLTRTSATDPILAAWLPCMILFPIGVLLTILAMNDSKLNINHWIFRLIRKYQHTSIGKR